MINPDQHPNPTQGGSYTRDPATGVLMQTGGTTAAPADLRAAAAAQADAGPAPVGPATAPAATPTEA